MALYIYCICTVYIYIIWLHIVTFMDLVSPGLKQQIVSSYLQTDWWIVTVHPFPAVCVCMNIWKEVLSRFPLGHLFRYQTCGTSLSLCSSVASQHQSPELFPVST